MAKIETCVCECWESSLSIMASARARAARDACARTSSNEFSGQFTRARARRQVICTKHQHASQSSWCAHLCHHHDDYDEVASGELVCVCVCRNRLRVYACRLTKICVRSKQCSRSLAVDPNRAPARRAIARARRAMEPRRAGQMVNSSARAFAHVARCTLHIALIRARYSIIASRLHSFGHARAQLSCLLACARS